MKLGKDWKVFYHNGSDYVEVTHITSVSTRDRVVQSVPKEELGTFAEEYVAGTLENGGIDFVYNKYADDASHQFLDTTFNSEQSNRNWKLTRANVEEHICSGHIDKLNFAELTKNGQWRGQCGVKFSGAVAISDLTP